MSVIRRGKLDVERLPGIARNDYDPKNTDPEFETVFDNGVLTDVNWVPEMNHLNEDSDDEVVDLPETSEMPDHFFDYFIDADLDNMIICCMFVIQMISDLLNLRRVITTVDDDCRTILLDLVNVAIILDLSDGYICDVPLDTVTAPGQVGAATFKNVAPPGNGCKFLMTRGITMDSGAGDHVFPKRMVSTRGIRISPGIGKDCTTSGRPAIGFPTSAKSTWTS